MWSCVVTGAHRIHASNLQAVPEPDTMPHVRYILISFFFFLKKSASPSIIVIVYEHQDFKQVSSCPGSSYPAPAGLSQQAVCTGGSALPWEPLRRLHPEAGGTSLPLAPFRGRSRWTLPGSGPRESLSEA